MEKLKFLAGIFMFTVLLFVSCSDDVNSNSGNNEIMNILSQGTWRVTLFNDSGDDETYHFTGYVFTFSNGTVTAKKNNSNVTGSYSTKIDDSKNKLLLNFGATEPFEELNDDWHIIEHTSSRIRLQDVSGGNGGTDLLTFEKN